MKINYADFLQITDSIRNKLYEYSFPPVERDLIMNALGLYGARIPGKLEPTYTDLCMRCRGTTATGPHSPGCPHAPSGAQR